MSATIPIYLALSRTRAVEQLAEALDADPRFEVVGQTDEIEILERDLACGDIVPSLLLVADDLCDDVAERVRQFVRRFRARIVAIGLHADSDAVVEQMLEAGAVHGETLRVDAASRLEPRHLGRLVHLLELLAEVRGLTARVPPDSGPAANSRAPRAVIPVARAQPEPAYTSDLVGATRRRSGLAHFQIIGIVSSTGGLHALETVLAGLPHDFPLPVAVVQHLSTGQEPEFVRLLGARLELNVCLVSGTLRPRAGTVYVAPAGRHLRVDALGSLTLSDEPRESPYCPSASVLLGSMADVYGARCIGVVLTGMGDDGAEGLLRIRRSGGRTIVQDRDTSQIFGMPHAAIEMSAAERVLPLTDIAGELLRLARLAPPTAT